MKSNSLQVLVEKGAVLQLARRTQAVLGDLAQLDVAELPKDFFCSATGLGIEELAMSVSDALGIDEK